MKSLALATAAGILLAGASMAQTTTGTGSKAGTGPTAAAPMTPAARTTADTAPNQAVATTSANSPLPAKGANSFTMGEARNRIEKNGFTNVSDLTKDDNGVWHGKAQKSGIQTAVWLDYKGNVGVTN